MRHSRYQKLRLDLRECIRYGRDKEARKIFKEIEDFLLQQNKTVSLHEVRLLYCETLLRAGKIQDALVDLTSMLKFVNKNTRLYLEALAIITLCLIRQNDKDANNYIEYTLESLKNIRNAKRRMLFEERFVALIKQETILSGLTDKKGTTHKISEFEEKLKKEVEILLDRTEEDILKLMRASIPESIIDLLNMRIQFLRPRLKGKALLLLPGPNITETKKHFTLYVQEETEITFRAIFARIICDPKNEIYKKWSSTIDTLWADKKILMGLIAASALNQKIAVIPLLASGIAFTFRIGIYVFCERYGPFSTMALRRRKGTKI